MAGVRVRVMNGHSLDNVIGGEIVQELRHE